MQIQRNLDTKNALGTKNMWSLQASGLHFQVSLYTYIEIKSTIKSHVLHITLNFYLQISMSIIFIQFKYSSIWCDVLIALCYIFGLQGVSNYQGHMTEGQKLNPQTGTSRLKINFIFLAKNMLKCTKGSFCYRDLQIKMNLATALSRFLYTTTVCALQRT